MSYTHDVSIVFYTLPPHPGGPVDQPPVPYSALKFWFDETYPISEAISPEWEAEVTYGDDYVLVQYNDVRWSGSLPHVRAVHSALAKFTEAFQTEDWSRAAYESVRLGEETDDIEELRTAWAMHRLWVSRKIILE